MASNPTDDTSDNGLGAESSDRWTQESRVISPLLDNIIGSASRFLSFTSKDSTSADANAIDAMGEGEDDAAERPTLLPSTDVASADVVPADVVQLDLAAQGVEPEAMESEIMASQQAYALQRVDLAAQYGTAGLLAELNALAETQQFQLAQHRDYVSRARAEQSQQIANWQERCAALEQQLQQARDCIQRLEQKHLEGQAQLLPLQAQCDAAQTQNQRLQTELLARRQRLADLEAQLELAEETLQEQQQITAAQAQGLVAMQADLSRAQAEVEALETRFCHQLQLRKQLREEGDRDRKGRSKARDRQLQLEQETTQMTGQLLRLGEELRQVQHQSTQWRRQAQIQEKTLWDIAQWASQAEAVPAALLELLEPVLNGSQGYGREESRDLDPQDLDAQDLDAHDPDAHGQDAIDPSEPIPLPASEPSLLSATLDSQAASALPAPNPASLDLPNFPNSST